VSDVTTVSVPAIDEIFMRTVTSLRDKIDRMNTDQRLQADSNPALTQARVDVVEVELTFKSVAVDASSGIAKLLVADKQTSSTLEIRLTTRVRVD
jgi:hypothetical protein